MIQVSDETARLYDLEDLQPRDVSPEIVASRLAKICRFSGAIPYHYSVAQHSVLVSQLCEGIWSLQALWHDAAEAFTGDLITPIKYRCPDYIDIETEVEIQLQDLGYPVPRDRDARAAIKAADRRAFEIEVAHLRHGVIDPRCAEMDWRAARGLFLARHDELVTSGRCRATE